MGDTGLSFGLGPSRRLALLKIRYLLGRAAAVPAQPSQAQSSGRGTVEPQPSCLLFLALQDELSHINARLNMGILGCEYRPTVTPTTVTKAPPGPSPAPPVCSL